MTTDKGFDSILGAVEDNLGQAWMDLAAASGRLHAAPQSEDAMELAAAVLTAREALTAVIGATNSLRQRQRGRVLAARRAAKGGGAE